MAGSLVALTELRAAMCRAKPSPLAAYIIFSFDSHLSEYTAPTDQRRAFISGFTGSAGTAVVTPDKALLWTDGRYWLQAANELPSHWSLMKDMHPDTPSIPEWLATNLPANSVVGCDGTTISQSSFDRMEKEVSMNDITLQCSNENLIDSVWKDRPARELNEIKLHPISFTGCSWQDKVKKVVEKMDKKKVEYLVISNLDEIAWLLNLRGSDIPFNACFFAYVVVERNPMKVNLFTEKFTLLKDFEDSEIGFSVARYGDFFPFCERFSKNVSVEKRVWASNEGSHGIQSIFNKSKTVKDLTPIAELKAVKNDVEIDNMKKSQNIDCLALIQFLHWLETNKSRFGELDEVDVSDKLEEFRRESPEFIRLSFPTISSTGPNAAIIHYHASRDDPKNPCRKLNLDEGYLVDSGAHYNEGTTDTTRTWHYGTPKAEYIRGYTLVLKGHIGLARAVFPPATKGSRLDTLARKPLWDFGLDYRHGTGHGVGQFLAVHEGPCMIGSRSPVWEINLQEGMVLSNEPGLYVDGDFGIRIESLIVVKKAGTEKFLGFETITPVPIQTHGVVDLSLLNDDELAWINQHNEWTRNLAGPALQKAGKLEALEWLNRVTQPLKR